MIPFGQMVFGQRACAQCQLLSPLWGFKIKPQRGDSSLSRAQALLKLDQMISFRTLKKHRQRGLLFFNSKIIVGNKFLKIGAEIKSYFISVI